MCLSCFCPRFVRTIRDGVLRACYTVTEQRVKEKADERISTTDIAVKVALHRLPMMEGGKRWIVGPDGGSGMSDTQVLLTKIAALRQRLDQAAGLANEARSAVTALLEHAVQGSQHDSQLDQTVRQATRAPIEGDREPPKVLTARARRVLERGQDLLVQLRNLAEDYAQQGEGSSPLTAYYRETVSLIDTALRTVALLPDSTTSQLHLCEGLEAALAVVAGRTRTLSTGAVRRRYEGELVERFTELLTILAAGRPITIDPFHDMSDEILGEVAEGSGIRFLEGDPERPAHLVACHSLTTARVAARIIRHDSRLRHQEHNVVLAALLHDVGMVCLPAGLLSHPGTLDSDGMRIIESHCRIGAELIAPLLPDEAWLGDVAEHHHERLDGQGYPDGLREGQIGILTRFLAVCDVYAAACVPRAYRLARATRTALADTLLLAEEGKLDARCAECLLHLSFYPVGSVVEMAHGALGVVVATPGAAHSLNAPARPVVAILTDSAGEPLYRPQHVDLARSEAYSIVRTLSTRERNDLFRRVPEWAA